PSASGVAAGTCTYTMPSTGGSYQFRLFSNDSFTVLATSNTVTVSGASPPTLTVSPSSVAGGGQVTVSWSGGTGASGHDWLAFYPAGATDNAYLDWFYPASCSKTPGATGSGGGSCTFTMPAGAGSYEFRLFSNDSFTRLATSDAVTVTG